MNIAHRADPVDQLVIAHLSRFAPLAEAELSYLASLLDKKRRYPLGEELIKHGQSLAAPFFLFRGWICMAAFFPDGRRQILDFFIPGDLVGYSSRPHAEAKSTYFSLTPVEVASAAGLLKIGKELSYPGLGQALCATEEEAEKRLCNQIIRNGRQSALESVASLLLELLHRLELSGHASSGRFNLPITQEMMADALGLSVVHVNRTLQQLKRQNIIAAHGVHVEILNLSELTALAQGFRREANVCPQASLLGFL